MSDSSDPGIPYDSFLLVSFGGPEGPDDVMPFLQNVLRGKHVPRQRMLEVAEHYGHFDGISPINQQNRELLAAVEREFGKHQIRLPVYWGNRNWHPLLVDAVRQMRDEGRRRTLAFFTSMFSSYSGCRQYRENVDAARQAVGPGAPVIDKLRFGFNHPGFIAAVSDAVAAAGASIDADAQTPLLFTAHSIPMSMADHCAYQRQLQEACRLVAEAVGSQRWQLVYQSRSGPPGQPWLEPDVCDCIDRLAASESPAALVIAPIGFVSDHIEVLYDLDQEAAALCRTRGIRMARAATAGTDPRFVAMIRQLVQERLDPAADRLSLGSLGPWHDVCPADCCLYTPAPRPDV